VRHGEKNALERVAHAARSPAITRQSSRVFSVEIIMHRIAIDYGYKTLDAVENALEGMFNRGEISEGERPEISTYKNTNGQKRWQITVPSYY
jgi:hypothetical protein